MIGIFSVTYGNSVFSSVLKTGDKSDLSQLLWSLFSFKIWMIVAWFERCGIVIVLRAGLNKFVRYLITNSPRCLRCLMFMPSGPAKLLFVLFEMASCTCVVVSSGEDKKSLCFIFKANLSR